jgi:hypothetical protein
MYYENYIYISLEISDNLFQVYRYLLFKMASKLCFICNIKKDSVKVVAFYDYCYIIYKCDISKSHVHNICESCFNYPKEFIKRIKDIRD